jgi:hypothetical protein
MSLELKIHHQVIEQHVAASPYVIGVELAEQIYDYVHEQHLGYYPAFDFFRDKDFIEPELIGTAESIAWLIENLAKEALTTYMRPMFVRIEFESLRASLFTLPTIRPSQSNALHALKNHFTPDALKITLSGFLKQAPELTDELLKQATSTINSALKGRFAYVEVTGVHLF